MKTNTPTSMQACVYFKKKHLLINLIVNLLFSFQAHSTNANQLYQQHNNILHFTVFEGAPNNTYIGNIRSSNGQVPYLILPAPQTNEFERLAALNINLQNGDLTTNSVLDRELREQYHFVALIADPFTEIRCTVTVRDINDNPPMFLVPNTNDSSFIIDMPEGQRGIRRSLPLAVDFDSLPYGIKEFRLISGNTPSGTFKLVEQGAPPGSSIPNSLDDSSSSITSNDPQLREQFAQQASVLIPSQPLSNIALTSSHVNALVSSSNGVLTSLNPQSRFVIDLEVNQTLDRETQSSYQLVVEAIDGGQTPLIGRLVVTVNVQDVNDNDPTFLKKNYELRFREDTLKGTLLIKVQATDIDLDANGEISYYIKSHLSSSQANGNSIKNNPSDNNIISSDGSTGRFAGININKQQPQLQQLQQQQQQQSSQRSVVGGVSAANKPTSSVRTSIEQNNEATTLVETSNNNSKTKSSAFSGTEQLFEIDPTKGEISLVSQLDYETDQWHELVIEARDHGKPTRSSYTTVKVFVIDIDDDPPPTSRQMDGDKQKSSQVPSMEASKSEFISQMRPAGVNTNSVDFSEVPPSVISWFAQINSSILFVIVLISLFVVASLVCLAQIKSKQSESDYNDSPNTVHTKQSPNHSTSNDHSHNGNENHHHEHQRRSNGSFAHLNGVSGGFESANGKVRYPYPNEYNIYHSLHPTTKPSCPPGGVHRSLERHQMNNSMSGGPQHHNGGGGSLTYAHHHSQVALLAHQAHHHQSTHHLSSVHHGGHNNINNNNSNMNIMNSNSNNNKGGTMNSMGTHHSAHPSASPLPATPNTTHSSGLPQNLHDSHHGLVHNTLLPLPPSVQQSQLPPTPCHANTSIFSWPQTPGSTMGCFQSVHNNLMHRTSADSTMDRVSPPASGNTQPLNRWFDLGVSSQLVYAQDWYGSYDWDYLADWTPDYHTLMPMIEGEASDY